MRYAWMLILCPALAGCSIGPKVETRHIFVHNGSPVTVMENIKVKVAAIKYDESGNIVPDEKLGVQKVDIGGNVTMPRDHHEFLMRRLRELQDRLNGK